MSFLTLCKKGRQSIPDMVPSCAAHIIQNQCLELQRRGPAWFTAEQLICYGKLVTSPDVLTYTFEQKSLTTDSSVRPIFTASNN